MEEGGLRKFEEKCIMSRNWLFVPFLQGEINWHLMKLAGYVFRFFTGGVRGKNHWHRTQLIEKKNLYKILRTGMFVCTKPRGMDPVFVYTCAACILMICGKIWWDSFYSLLYLYYPFPRHLLLAITENEHWLRYTSCLTQKGSISCHDLED